MNKELHDLLIKKLHKQYTEDIGLSGKELEMVMKQRENEMHINTHPAIEAIKKYLGYNFKNKTILVVGVGMGKELTVLNSEGADVYILEPDEDRIDVQFLRAKLESIDSKHIIKGVAEKIPFDNEFFDLVYCYTVLEHVKDVEKSLKEMHRVLKKDGIIFIETPDYRIPYEPHYKILFPWYLVGLTSIYRFFPQFLQKFIIWTGLKLKRRPTKFLKSINFLNEKCLKKIFFDNGWQYFQLHFIPVNKKNIFYKFHRNFGIEKNLWFYIFKN